MLSKMHNYCLLLCPGKLLESEDQVSAPIKKANNHTSGVGTQAYSSPEQLKHGYIDYKSDMYSLGIILFELYQPFSTGKNISINF